ncbi:MAG TPA: hypothetical protein VLW65_08925 [Bryobacteraceae bacterium]|nr:hypothetical protein [Bryobacteraceae bacterium]
MSARKRIPALHQALVAAAVKAALGERAVVREVVEVPAGPPLRVRVDALGYGVRTFWNHWTGRHPNRSLTTDETQD